VPVGRAKRVDIAEVEGLGNGGEHLARARIIVPLFFQLAPHLCRLGRFAQPFVFRTLLVWAQRLIVD